MGKQELKELVDELIKKMSGLYAQLYHNSTDPIFSTADASNAQDIMLKIKEKIFSPVNLDNDMVAVITTYFESKKERLAELIQRFYPSANKEALDTKIYKVYCVYRDTFKAQAAGVQYAEIDLEVLLRLFHDKFISKLSGNSQLIAEINALLDPFNPLYPGVDPNSDNMPYKILIRKFIYASKCYTSSFTPEAEIMEDQEDFEIFLKQCICIIDKLIANTSAETKQQLLAALPKHRQRVSTLGLLLAKWLESPVLLAMQDHLMPINQKHFPLKLCLNLVKDGIRLNNIDFNLISIVYRISNLTGVAIDDALAQEFNIEIICQTEHLFLLSALTRLVDKVHRDHGAYEERMNFTMVLAELLYCTSDQDNLFILKERINAIEEAIAFAIKFDFSFKEVRLRDHHPRPTLKC